MTDSQRLSRGQDYLGNIARMLGDLQGVGTLIHELIQNADDAPGATRMRFTVQQERLEVWNDGLFDRCSDVTSAECEWLQPNGHRCDFHSFRLIGSEDKRGRPGTTGAFGIGFNSVYQITDRPELLSNGEHWIIDEMAPHDGRIEPIPTSAIPDGTTFRLPWAVAPSPFRKAMRQEPVSADVIASFPSRLRDIAPRAMPFLKKLQAIEVHADDETSVFETHKTTSSLTLISNGGVASRWFVISGDFNDEAEELKEDHPNLIEDARSSTVTIALPLDETPGSGLLFATLPTEESAHLPLLINADFFPASDRKRIRFDDAPEGAWNRVAISAAADLIASGLEDLPSAIGNAQVVGLLRAAQDLADRAARGEADRSFVEFWRSLVAVLPSSHVTPLEGGGYATPREARLWNEPAELEAVAVLSRLGIGLVDEEVKDAWYRLRSSEVGIENLHLRHVVAALLDRSPTSAWSPRDRYEDVGLGERELGLLRALVEALLSIRDRSNETSRADLCTCAIGPCTDGLTRPFATMVQVDADTERMLAAVGIEAYVLDCDRLGRDLTHLLALVACPTPSTVLSYLEEALADGPCPMGSSRIVLAWAYQHRDELSECAERVARLPIFPTATEARPLTELALPGNFRDELGLARIVRLDGIKDMEQYLEKLGARHLSLETYCTDFLARAFAEQELSTLKRERAVRVIARGFPEIRDDPTVRLTLRSLPLVQCVDGDWRSGDEVYLPTDGLAVLVGPDAPVAALPIVDRSTHADLYEWLGATTEPRPADIEARCRHLARSPSDHRVVAEAIIQYVARRFTLDEDQAKADFSGLRKSPWLPTEGQRGRGYAPGEVYLRFRQSLFASQARFIDVSRTTERTSGEFLRWLGLGQEPAPEQVVRHLLHCATEEKPVGEDMWQYLNLHADDPALDQLRGERCLLLRELDRYVAPREVYWGPHPFGRWRRQLAPNYSQYRDLLDRLEVPESPSPEDAVDVLLIIASDHWGEEAPLFADDVHVVRACWRLISEALMGETTDPSILDELSNAEVVLDSHEWLRKPSDVYFRDSVTLANRFPVQVLERLVDRPEGIWQALEGAGVRNLSDAVTTDIVEHTLLDGGGTLAERLWRSRRRLVIRVLSRQDHEAAKRMDDLQESLHLQRVANLQIRHTIEVDGADHTSDSFQRGALYLKDERQLLWVEDRLVEPNWLEVARELVRALDVAADVAPAIASVLRGVLGAPTEDIARQELDELGYPALDELDEVGAEPSVSGGLGGAATRHQEDEELDDDTAQSAADDLHTADQTAADHDHSAPNGSISSCGSGGGPDDSGSPGGDRVGGDGEPDGGVSTTGSRDRPGGGQSKLRSYVAPVGASDRPAPEASADAEVDRCAIAAVLDYERAHGREPEVMVHENPGYDVRSEGPSGEVRYIEVKGTAVRWGDQGVAISSRQYLEGARRREDFWLYIVDHALSRPRVHAVQDPVSQIDQYLFDDGWRVVSEKADIVRPQLCQLQLPDSPDGMSRPLPFRDAETESTPAGWFSMGLPDQRDDWFAVRIKGDSAGLKYRGGVAIVRPTVGEPEPDDRVLVALVDRVDPDTEGPVAIRLWVPDTNEDGTLLRIRLFGDGGVGPITVDKRDGVLVLGEVIHMLDSSDLADLGYLDPTPSEDG